MNKKPARRFPLLAPACVVLFSVFQLVATSRVRARPDALEDCVERLAKKAAALPHEKRMSLVWTNQAGLSEQRTGALRASFAAQMETAQVRFVEGESAAALRVSIEQTPSQIVFAASVPTEGGANVVIEEVARAAAGSDDSIDNSVKLEKQRIWRQEARILSAVVMKPAGGTENRLAVLTDETLTIYREEAGDWKVAATKEVPPPRQGQRSARGQLLVSEDQPDQIGLLLGGRRCEANLSDASGVACVAATVDWPTGRLLTQPSCGPQTWWLKSDGNDFAKEDRLSVRAAGAKEAVALAELGVAGPVISIAAGKDSGSATVTIRNLATGNYEVYRVGLGCGD